MNGTPVHGFTAIINGDSVEVSEGTLEVENTGYDSTYRMRVVVSDSIGSVDTLLGGGRNGRFTVELNPATYTSHLNLTIHNQWNTPMRHIMVIVGADTFYTDTSGNVSIPLVMNYGDTVEVEPVIEGVHYDSTELRYEVPYGVDVTDTVRLNQY